MLSIGLFYFALYALRTRIYKDFECGNYSWIFGAKMQIGSFINGIKYLFTPYDCKETYAND